MRSPALAVVVALVPALVVTSCARIDNAQPAPPPAAAPPASASASASGSASASASGSTSASAPAPASAPAFPKPSGIGGPCFVSPVRTADGKPSAEQKCAPGLACDYRDAVPDGPGKCRRR